MTSWRPRLEALEDRTLLSVTLLDDNFNTEHGGSGVLNYNGFANWVVTRGTVDLIGAPNFFDYYPGNGLYVDLDGSTNRGGKLESRTVFTLDPGIYELRFDLGNDPGFPGDINTAVVSLGSVYSESFSRVGYPPDEAPLLHIVRTFTVTNATIGKLAFDQAGNDNGGLVIDNVTLVLLVNEPPPADAGGPYTVPEGGSVQLDGSGSSDPDQPGSTLTYEWDLDGDGQYDDASSIMPSFSAAGLDGPGSVQVGLRITDNGGMSSTDTAEIIITNVAPKLTSFSSSSPGCGGAKEGQMVMVGGSFTDAGTPDTHTAIINWGDGTSSPAGINEAGGAGNIAANHTYTHGGTYTITATLRDNDGASDESSTPAFIAGTGLKGNILQVIGTNDDDFVTIVRRGTGEHRVISNFPGAPSFITFRAPGLQQVQVVLCDGNDRAAVAGDVRARILMDGGKGHDFLIGGNSGSILLGGAGRDHLLGGSGRDLLIGGADSDTLNGLADDDVLIGSATTHDADANALNAIMDEWSANRPPRVRASNLRGTGMGPRLNGNNFLQVGTTVFDDFAVDYLMGSAGFDWCFANTRRGGWDNILDPAELLDQLGQ